MHHTQDIILSIGNLIFAIALVPSVFSNHKPALTTSLITAGVLIVFACVYVSLNFWFATVNVLITAALWLTLAVQKYTQHDD